MLKIVQFAKISGFQKIDVAGHFRFYLCHFWPPGQIELLGGFEPCAPPAAAVQAP